MSSWRWRSLSRSVVVVAAAVRVLVAVFFDVDRLILPVLVIFLRLDKLNFMETI